jgi:hypothetical protein
MGADVWLMEVRHLACLEIGVGDEKLKTERKCSLPHIISKN